MLTSPVLAGPFNVTAIKKQSQLSHYNALRAGSYVPMPSQTALLCCPDTGPSVLSVAEEVGVSSSYMILNGRQMAKQDLLLSYPQGQLLSNSCKGQVWVIRRALLSQALQLARSKVIFCSQVSTVNSLTMPRQGVRPYLHSYQTSTCFQAAVQNKDIFDAKAMQATSWMVRLTQACYIPDW